MLNQAPLSGEDRRTPWSDPAATELFLQLPPNWKIPALVLGAAVGALLAATGLVERQAAVPGNVLAEVNGEAIAEVEYLNYLQAMQLDRRRPLDAEQRLQVLDRMIEERLLLQRAEQSGLLRSDTALRKAIVDAMVQSIVASAPPAQPGETELLHFYRENIAYFSSPPLLQVQRMEFRGEGAARRARDARAALIDGESFDEVEAALADKPVVAVPGAPIPANRLVQYLGPTPVGQLTELEVGAISGPHAREGGLQLVRLAGRVEGVAPPLQQVRAQVLREYRRRASEAHLREYLDDLRAAADIRHQAVPEAASGPAAR